MTSKVAWTQLSVASSSAAMAPYRLPTAAAVNPLPTRSSGFTPLTRSSPGPGQARPNFAPRRGGPVRPAVFDRTEARRLPIEGRQPRVVGGNDAAARFSAALRTGPADPVQPLPGHLEPLARAIVGSHRVSMRTGPTTQRALVAAGKQAATFDRVIHLRRAPDRTPRSAEIVAHELVHAAHPSPRPRFLDDDRHSHEETVARRTGGLVRALSAPEIATVPAVGARGLSVGAGAGVLNALSRDSRQRSAPPLPSILASASSHSKGPGPTMPESSLVRRTAELFRQASLPAIADPTTAVRREPDPDDPRPGDPPIVRRYSGEAGAQVAGLVDAPAASAVQDHIASLEQQVIEELERRGLRHDTGVF
ncbi:MAG: DUF4157 domain-containing protein [Actinomycetota bacterium]|nr:DUF4157 domain-containing protein [Actinomycetota bacterium]